MIYVTSDLHGCPVETLQRLLEQAGFSREDFLFVLGDVIDRGAHGARLLLWLTQQPNVQLILGNHEALMLACDFLFEEVTPESLDRLDVDAMRLLENWYRNGGGPTIAGLKELMKEDPELVQGILEELRDAPLYDCVEAGGRRYVLVHAGLGNFAPNKRLADYDAGELLMTRPTLDTRYDGGATVIFGHTPTECFGSQYRGRAVRTDTWICIDTGADPMLLRLGDEKAFYVEGESRGS